MPMTRLLPLLMIACGPPTDSRALNILEEGLTSVPPEDECLVDPAVMCCDDLTLVRLDTPSDHFDASENDLGGLGMAEEINFLYQTGVAAFTSSCPGTNASLTTLDLRILGLF